MGNDRIVFSCPKCNLRRKTYFTNSHLKIRCKRCFLIYKVSEGKNIQYKEADKPPLNPLHPVPNPITPKALSVKHKKVVQQDDPQESSPVKLIIGLIIISVVSYYILRFLKPEVFK